MEKEQFDFRSKARREKYVERALNRDYITESDRKLIRMYLDSMTGIAETTEAHKIHVLVAWRKFVSCEYKDLTLDVMDAADKTIRRAGYKQNALNSMYKELRQFIRYLSYKKIVAITSDDLRYHLKAPLYTPYTETSKDMFTEKEINKLIDAAICVRDRAIFATAADSGARIHEIAFLRWGDLEFDDDGGVVATFTDRKTDTKRTTWLCAARPALALWKASYPGTPEGNAFVFCNLRQPSKPIAYVTYNTILKDALAASGIKKRGHWHLFRKSRATAMAREGYDDNAVKLALWGRLSSKMQSTYVQLSGRDVINKFKQKAGVRPRTDIFAPKTVKCLACGEINPMGATSCQKCGRNPSNPAKPAPSVADLKRDIVDQLLADPRIAEIRKILIADENVIIGVPHDDDDQASSPVVAK